MRRSATVTLTLVPALVAATCGSDRPDPCVPATYNAEACQYAVDHQGYYHNGMWIGHSYARPFLFYSNGYSSYVAGGGQLRSLPSAAFAVPPAGTPGAAGAGSASGSRGSASATGGTTRGGFGGIGAGHSSAGT
jgi:hypothetical protein